MRLIRAFGRAWTWAALLAVLTVSGPAGSAAAPLFLAAAGDAALAARLAAPRQVQAAPKTGAPSSAKPSPLPAKPAPVAARQQPAAPPPPAARSAASPASKPAAQAAAAPATKAAPGGPAAASGSTTPGDAAGGQAPQLEKAVQELAALVDAPGAKRDAWNALEDRFRKLTASSSQTVAAKAQYYVGRLREEAADRFRAGPKGGEDDARKAYVAYGDLVRRFPRSGLADDGLYRQAVIQAEQLNDPASAGKSLEFLLAEYPAGDMAAKAKAMQTELAKAARHAQAKSGKTDPSASAKAPPPAEPAKTAAKDKPKPETNALPDPPVSAGSSASGALRAPLVQPPAKGAVQAEAPKPSLKTPVRAVTAMSVQNGDAFARVILDLDGKADFAWERQGGGDKDGKAGKLAVTFSRLKASAQVKAKRSLKGGLLRQLALTADGKDLASLTIDASSLGRSKVYSVEDPYRVFIDIFPAGAQPLPETAAKAASPADSGKLDNAIEVKSGARKQAANLVEQLGLTVRRIMIDAGHGGKDPGAMAYGLKEKDVNLRVAFLLGSELRARGFEVLFTRQKDVFIPLEDRPVLANRYKADMFISIHCNAAPDANASGLETYTLNLAKTADASRVAARENAASARTISDLQVILADLMLSSKKKESDDLAHFVQGEVIRCARRSNFSLRDHGAKEAPFYVLMGARMPAVLVEIGYITNKDEADRMNSDAYLRAVAVGLAEGVVAYKAKIERFASL